jgi:hypothetical protein
VISCRYCAHSFLPELPVACPHCHQTTPVPIGYRGSVVICGHCGQAIPKAAEDGPPAPAAPPAPAVRKLTVLDDRVRQLSRELSAEDVGSVRLQEANQEIAILRSQLADVQVQLEQARSGGLLRAAEDRHAVALRQMDRERAELGAELERARAGHEQQLNEERTRAAGARQELERRLQEEQAARNAEVERARQEWEAHHQSQARADLGAELDRARAGHEQRLSAERARAAGVRQELERRLQEEQAARNGEVERARQEWEAHHQSQARYQLGA